VVVGQLGYSWQVALGAVFISGMICLVLSILPIRKWIIDSIPHSQKMAISAGIGFFLGLIALESAGVVVSNPVTLVTVGSLAQTQVMLAASGFVVMIALSNRQVPGAIIIGILLVMVIGILLGLSPSPDGVIDMPPSLAPTLLQLNIVDAWGVGLVVIVFSFVMVDLFDTAGTLVGVAHRADLFDKNGHLPRLKQALIADSSATVIGSLLGTSSTTSYIESVAGVKAGGRSGLTAVVAALLFLLALVFGPLVAAVPDYATAPAILFVACIMARGLVELDWEDVTEYAPAIVTALSMPFTFSIATGIGLGFVTYVAVKTLSGRVKDTSPAIWFIAALFMLKFAID
jgi:AGZA family xanthine/uracil permease-like MFS transporter